MSNISTRGRRDKNYCIFFTSDGRPIKRYAPPRRRTLLSQRHIAWLEAYLATTDDPVRREVIKDKLAGRQKAENPEPVEAAADAVLIDRFEHGIIRRFGRAFDELRATGYSKKNRPPERPPNPKRGNKKPRTEHNGGDFIDKRAWRDLKSRVAVPPRCMGKCTEEAEILVDGNWLTLKKRYVKNPGARIEIGRGRWITTAGLVFRECLVTGRPTPRLDTYRKAPKLTPDEENILAPQARAGDQEAAATIARAFMPRVFAAVKNIPPDAREDMIAAGLAGLAQSIESYPGGPIRFRTHAMRNIRWHVLTAKEEWAKGGQKAKGADRFWFRRRTKLLEECFEEFGEVDLTSEAFEWLAKRVAAGSKRPIEEARRAVARRPGGGHAIYDDRADRYEDGGGRAAKGLLEEAEETEAPKQWVEREGEVTDRDLLVALEGSALKGVGARGRSDLPYALERFLFGPHRAA